MQIQLEFYKQKCRSSSRNKKKICRLKCQVRKKIKKKKDERAIQLVQLMVEANKLNCINLVAEWATCTKEVISSLKNELLSTLKCYN